MPARRDAFSPHTIRNRTKPAGCALVGVVPHTCVRDDGSPWPGGAAPDDSRGLTGDHPPHVIFFFLAFTCTMIYGTRQVGFVGARAGSGDVQSTYSGGISLLTKYTCR